MIFRTQKNNRDILKHLDEALVRFERAIKTAERVYCAKCWSKTPEDQAHEVIRAEEILRKAEEYAEEMRYKVAEESPKTHLEEYYKKQLRNMGVHGDVLNTVEAINELIEAARTKREFLVDYEVNKEKPKKKAKEKKVKINTLSQLLGGVHKNIPYRGIHFCCERLRVAVLMAEEPDIVLAFTGYKSDEKGERWYCKCPFCDTDLTLNDNELRPTKCRRMD